MKLSYIVLLGLLGVSSLASAQQSGLVSKWEKVGQVNFTAAARQSLSTIVATTSHGYIYITHDNGTTWQRQEIGDTLDLTAISFGDSLHGVILDNGDALTTTDGGATWQGWPEKKAPIPAPFYVACLGADTVFIVNWIGNIYRSVDGGATWVEQFTVSDTATSTSNVPTKLVFFDNQHGYVLGVGMYVETSDAGEHWTAREITGQDGAATLYDIDFYNSDTGVMSGSDDYFTTTDAGTTWADHPMPHDERNDYLPIIQMFGPQSFFMFGMPNAYYYTSNDFGATFALTPMRQANSITGVVKTGSGGWLAVGGGWLPDAFQYGAGGTILRAAFPPEGATTPVWDVLAECPMGPGPSVHATNGSMLQCVSSSETSGWNALPLISLDSGILWHVTNDVVQDYSAINFPSPDTGYLYNSDDLTAGMQTLDSGQSWHSIEMNGPPISAGRGIGQISFGSADTGYAFNGYLLTTTDEGIDWKLDSLPPASTESPYPGYKFYERNIRAIVSPDGLHAFLLAYVVDTLIVRDTDRYKSFWDSSKTQNLIYRTTDGGATWNNLGNFPTNDLRISLYFRNDLVGYVLSDSGRIYRTSDGGNSWNTEQLAPFNHSFNSINFLNDRIGFLSLDSQAVLCTTDGGLNWTWLLIPTNREEVTMATGNIAFPDSNTVLIWGTRTLNVTPSIQDYGLYRAKLNIPAASIVEHEQQANPNTLSVSTYPNPAQSGIVHVTVSAPEHSPMRFDVLDLLGRTLFSRMETNADFTLDLQSLPDGVYTLRCTAGVESAVTTFTIDR